MSIACTCHDSNLRTRIDVSCQFDNYLFIDSEDEQDIKTSRLNNDSKLLTDAKQLLDYDIIPNSSVTSATQDTDTMSLASTATISTDS